MAVVISGDGDSAVLEEAIEAQLNDLPVRLIVEHAAGLAVDLPAQVEFASAAAARHSAATVFWFDTSVPERVFVFLGESAGSRILVRVVEARAESERTEAVSIIVRNLVQAVLAGGRIGVAMPASLATESARPPDSEPDAGRTLEPVEEADVSPRLVGLQLGYVLESYSDRLLVQHGVGFALAVFLDANWSVLAGYRILTAVQSSATGVDLWVERHPIELGLQFQWTFDAWALGAQLYGLADCLTRRASVSVAELSLTSAEPSWVGGLGLLAEGSYRIRPYFRAFLGIGLDVMVNQVRYAVDDGAGPTTLLVSGIVHPRMVIGAAVDLL
ncbi:MAG: hypothetical protein JXB32_19245 [Deltaproteobacteria bacterium]|nr:hypothetical protein [Deltaproteobacteria bacterium]